MSPAFPELIRMRNGWSYHVEMSVNLGTAALPPGAQMPSAGMWIRVVNGRQVTDDKYRALLNDRPKRRRNPVS